MSGAGSDPGTGDEGPQERDLLAAEYVLGLLPPDQARALEALLPHDPAIQDSIDAWQDRIAPLAAAVPEIVPPDVLWQRLALATGIESPVTGSPMARRAPGARAWRSRNRWRLATLGASAIAASLAFVLLARPALDVTNEPLLAALSPSGSPAVFLIRVGEDGIATVIAVGNPDTPAGRALELWAVNAGATVPVSLGLLPGSGRARITVPPRAGTQLLVSQEPAGGSPTGQPTGPVVYAGLLTSGG